MEPNGDGSSMSRGPVSEESSTESDSDSFGKSVSVSRRKKCIIEDSDSDSSDSFVDVFRKRKRAVNHLISDSESSSSSSTGSDVVRRKRSATRISSDSDSNAKKEPEAASSSDSDGQSEKCPICLIRFKTQEVASPEACEHCFCVECIEEWAKNVNTCPVDRQPFSLIVVRKCLNGKILRQIPVQPATQGEVEAPVDDVTSCEVCGSSDREDRMLLCDGCDLGFHLECLNPPLEDVPPGAWYCADCGPEHPPDVNIYMHEVEMLLDDAHDVPRPTGPRRTNSNRLIPRTRQSERVRARVISNRTRNRANSEQLEEHEEIQVVVRHGASTSTASVSRSRATTRRKRRKKRKQPRIRITYEIDQATGEEIRIETKTRRYRKRRKKKKNRLERPKTVKKRLAVQLGMCRPRQPQQTIPEVANNPPNNSLGFRRFQAGIPSLHLFGREELLSCSEGEDDYGFGVVARRPNPSDVNALRRNINRKAVLLPPAADAGGTCDLLSSIMENQEKLYSKKTKLAVKNNGSILTVPKDLNSNENRVDLNDLSNVRIRTAPTSSTSSAPVNTNLNGGNSEYRPSYSNLPTSNQSEEVPMNSSVSTSGRDEGYEASRSELVPSHLSDDDKKKNEASESDLDIYSDIETVSTSKDDLKADSPVVVANLNLQSDEETNNSDVDLVIDTEKEKEDTEKEKEETVSSTTQIETVLEEDKEEEEDEEDGCPNFSIYSTETKNVAKNDLDVLQVMDKTQNSDEVGSSGDVVVEPAKAKPSDGGKNSGAAERKKETGLYSDSDDELVKIDKSNKPFGIGDISAMTEDISEEERSYTPCLDEKNANNKEFLDGLDTEAISDEEKNDFDESHEFKTVSDGDALEINAKESELDFTRAEDFEEGEIVDKSKGKKVEVEEEKKEENKENQVEKVVPEKVEKKNEEKDKDKEKEKEKDSGFKKISRSNKERNYRDKERSKSREKKKDKKKERRKEIERYNVRSVVADKPRRMKDKFGRDARRRSSSSRSNTPYRSSSRHRRSYSRSKGRRRRRSRSPTRSRSRRRSRSRNKRRNSSMDRKRRKSRGRSKKRSRSFSPRRRRDWKYSVSKSKSPERRRGGSPSWTPPRVIENPVKNNLTVILTNDSKKRRDKKKMDKKGKKEAEKRKRKRDKTPPPSKEVFASGDNILVSVSFNEESSAKRNRREKNKDARAQRKKVNDLSSVKPVAIIDLDRSPFKELTPSPNDVIVLSDSDNNENLPQENVCDSSSQQPENYAIRELRTENYGPKTPPEPQVKFSLNAKATQIRAINNPLHEPDDLAIETQTEVEHKGPNTPPEPPNSPPSSPDAYDPFDPTKSRSPTPEKCEKKPEEVVEKVEEAKPQTPDIFKKSHTPPVVPEIQAADSQSNALAAEIAKTSPILQVTKSTPQTSYSVAPAATSTPLSINPPRINILNTTILSVQSTSASAVAQRNAPPKPTIKISPTKNLSNVGLKKVNESNESNCEFDSPYSPGPSDYEDLFEPPAESLSAVPPSSKPKGNNAKNNQSAFDNLFGSSPKLIGSGNHSKNSIKANRSAEMKKKNSKAKIIGVMIDEESLKILDDVPNSAVEMQVKSKFLKKLNRQERVVEEVKLVLKPHYNRKHINKEEYKDILRRAVPKICHNRSGEINPKKIQNLIEAYVRKVRHSKKVTSSSNTMNPQK